MNTIVALGKNSKNLYKDKINFYLSKLSKIFETELINFDLNNKKNHDSIKFNNKFAKDKNIFFCHHCSPLRCHVLEHVSLVKHNHTVSGQLLAHL